MIRLRKLYTFPEVTRTITFKDGLNFILGEKDSSSNKTNGVGKSMSIEFINFCLLRKKEGSRVLKIPRNILPPATRICLDIEIHEHKLTIIRTTNVPDQPSIIKDGKEIEFSNIENATRYLSDLFYTNSSKINLNPSFRELINPLIRDERSEFKDIVSYFDTKNKVPQDHVPTLYLLDFDMAAYRLAKETIREIDKITILIRDIKKGLTSNGIKSLTDVRAEVNSLEGELKKLEDELEELKTHESFDKFQDELINIDIILDQLRTKQSFLKSSIQKIRSLPKAEKIDEKDVLFVYEQFKEGLGIQLKKSFDEVNSFKERIEDFQNVILNEKLKKLLAEFKDVNKDLKTFDENRSTILRILDKEGVFKNLKQSLAIYHQKSEESINTRSELKRYDTNVIEKNTLLSRKSQLVTKLDLEITKNYDNIHSFNLSISDIHQYIMGNRGCSFDIVTKSSETYKDIILFNMTIDYGGSHSIERVKVFIYDLALLINEVTRQKHPNFLIHDNIFDVDQDTLLKSLNFLYSLEDSRSFQYILTLNSDKLESVESSSLLDFDIHDYSREIFTKSRRFIIGEKYNEK
ncbi:hypothetical protein OA88_14510 [Flavobacterium sp. JRM]|nr:hypothetical protein OA88_14510 [Flavobacterium sp. JRM]